MPCHIEERDEGRGLLRVWTGVVTGSDVIAAIDDYRTTVNLTKLEYIIADHEGVTAFEATADEIREVANADARLAELKPHLVIALVAPTDIVFGLARMWEVFTERPGWSARVFRSRPEAEAWVHESLGG